MGAANPLVQLCGETGAAFVHRPPERYIPTGLDSLDHVILGIIAGELTLVGGQPGAGKTALTMQVLLTAAQNGLPAKILSLEMGQAALVNRIVAGLTGVSMRRIRTRSWKDQGERDWVAEAIDFLASIPLYVEQQTVSNPDALYRTVSAWKEQGIEIGAIDYLQLLGGSSESRMQDVGNAIRAAKAAAKETDLPLIAISSLNRGANGRANQAPRFSDLRDSGELEYTADTVIVLAAPEDTSATANEIEVAAHVIKQRNGGLGVARLKFIRSGTRFETL
jgi:replicative DNA helicase